MSRYLAMLVATICMVRRAVCTEASITTINLAESNNLVFGMTLDAMLHSGPPSPFTADSFAAFQAVWDNENQTEWLQLGTWKMTTDIVTSQDEAVEAMDISGSLSVSYMAFTGEAHMSFASENVQSSSDTSVIITAEAAGKKRQMSIADTNLLELKDTSIDNLEEFEALYGSYLIVGFEYGGEILFQATHSAASDEDKLAISGGLELSFAGAGFPVEISGSADVSFDKTDISRSVNDKKSFSIKPNTDSEDADDLITALIAISTGGLDDDSTLYDTLAQKAQNILSGDQVDPLKAIVIPLSSVSAVNDRFEATIGSLDTANFFSFLNDVFMAVEALSQQLELIESEWRTRAPATVSTAQSTWGEWEFLLLQLREEMATINNYDDVINGSKAYEAIRTTKDWDADVFEAQSFIEITGRGLEYQFEVAITEPYKAMLECVAMYTVCTSAPTSATTEPSSAPTVEPTISTTDGDSSSANGHGIAVGVVAGLMVLADFIL